MVIQKYRRGPVKGYQAVDEGRVIDAASNEFLDFMNLNAHRIKQQMPEALQSMCMERWRDSCPDFS